MRRNFSDIPVLAAAEERSGVDMADVWWESSYGMSSLDMNQSLATQ